MKETMLVTGGCRSGKSAYAQRAAEQMAVTDRYFLATCQPADEEMRQRVARHQQDRGEQWQTRECPLDIEPVLRDMENDQAVVLVDCLTLWMSNLLAVTEDPAKIERRVAGLVEAVDQTVASVILVSNEVGCGIVPENRLARLYRDMVGLANQALARQVDHVAWMVSGMPVIVKGEGMPS
ncbi:MAG: bifunctional adenosylcobinamide kinase/adenosylcobinamide-phosphate guanylyltransferase [Desulfosudaceae bacterium]